ncbi:cytokine receptor isoform X2 [Sitophilus oryzae]|uniref:Cytokine receptor isoform X2 n=1 Tax=Sitophilus oryzae TaxID=7048 RepID=A0A6J2XBN4_SITOR|nr:cytokine receptor isoform X2 [Sitophilus oryzae]
MKVYRNMAYLYRGLIFLISCIEIFSKTNPEMSCDPLSQKIGYTYPRGDITLEYGEDLNLWCVLHQDKAATYLENASSLMKFTYEKQAQISEIVNSTTIKLHIEKHPLTTATGYTCEINGETVCYNVVIVGTKPKEVMDFDCVGRNYENFTCSWTAPENYVKTEYFLEYYIPQRPQRTAIGCPKIEQDKDKYSCTWSFYTKPQYRHSNPIFEFNLTASNVFGKRTLNKTIVQYSRIIPNPPVNLTATAISPNSIKLSWAIPVLIRSFPPGLDFRVSYWEKHSGKWTTLYNSSNTHKPPSVEYTLENLPYAHCLYDIRVALKSNNATGEFYWSNNSTVAFYSQSKLPDRPPKTNIGGFEVEGRNIIIYWQKLPQYEENGSNFTYHIEVDGDPSIKAKKILSTNARFEKMENRNYTFKIWSKNEIGYSKTYSVVSVPATYYFLKPALNLVKVFKGNGIYELEWSDPAPEKSTNYTIFWSDGNINWTTVDKGISNKVLSLSSDNNTDSGKDSYSLALSVNGHETSSGLTWAECTPLPGTGSKLREVYVKDVSSRSILVAWSLKCYKKANLLGINIIYCKTEQFSNTTACQNDTIRSTNITKPGAETGLITGLTPYTRYKIQVKPILYDLETYYSDEMVNSTFEGEPTEPRNLKVIGVTNSSITIEFQKPEEENGYIREYNISIFPGMSPIRVPPEPKKEIYQTTIEKLTPSTNYTIRVEACTVKCSTQSIIQTATENGRPNIVPKPFAQYDNSSVLLSWHKPTPDQAKVDFYEIWIGTNKNDEPSSKGQIYKTFSLQYNTSMCKDDEKLKTIYVMIRGVNMLADKRLEGPWSEKMLWPCNTTSETWVVITIIAAIFIFGGLMVYLGKKLWGHISLMRNVTVKLPDGLADLVNYPEKEKQHSDVPLLNKKFPGQTNNALSGESSGCSSGQESVASSIESTGHLSASDSGTEQPRSPSLGETDGRDIALRQRATKNPNVKKSEYVTMPELPQTPWSNKQAPGYSVIGLIPTAAKKPEVNSDYLMLSDLAPKPSAYMPFTVPISSESTTEPVVTEVASSGYVPFMSQEPASKNTDYVMAGTPSKNIEVPSVPCTRKEESSGYVKAPPIDTNKPLLFQWQQQSPVETPSSGYVVVGDPKPHCE